MSGQRYKINVFYNTLPPHPSPHIEILDSGAIMPYKAFAFPGQ